MLNNILQDDFVILYFVYIETRIQISDKTYPRNCIFQYISNIGRYIQYTIKSYCPVRYFYHLC